jgi:YidC/Oxa1 family membrane protein insertase
MNILLAPFHLIGVLYTQFIYEPLLNALVFLYATVALQDLGLAIILLTLIIRLILFPLFQKSMRHQAKMQKIQPFLKKIQEEHKDNREKQTEAMLALFREHDVNPVSGIGFLLLQLPILIALYQIFLHVFDPASMSALYSFVPRPESLSPMFLGLINLGNSNILIVGLAAIAQYFQGKTAIPPGGGGKSPAEVMAQRMVLIAPVMTLLIFMNFPAAVSLYWIVTSLFSIVQQEIINRQIKNGQLG